MTRMICIAFLAIGVAAQTKPAFEVATVRPAAPVNMAKIMALRQTGGQMPLGPHVDPARAQYTSMTLKELIACAWSIKPDQVVGPAWLDRQRFDIVAKMPDASAKEDAPVMLQALLADRFKLVVHQTTAERPILALIVEKGGPKLKESTEAPVPIDDSVPLKPGEIRINTPDGPVTLMADKSGGLVFNLGVNGRMSDHFDMTNGNMHTEGSAMTMSGLAIVLTQSSQDINDDGPPVVDLTGLKGRYQFAMDYARPDRTVAVGEADVASGPVSGFLMVLVKTLGLKLERRKAMLEQLVVDRAEKTPTEN